MPRVVKDWEESQKKVFIGWANLYYSRRGFRINSLNDFRDGVYLCVLLEELSGKKLKYVSNPTTRFQKLQNLSYAIKFILDQGVRLVSCGAEDIADGNEKITLGLFWTLIQKFQIQAIEAAIGTNNTNEKVGENSTPSAEGSTPKATRKNASTKDLMLSWTKNHLARYPDVAVRNLNSNWRDGKLLLHLVHKARPDLVDLDDLSDDPVGNLAMAFDLAYEHLGIPKLLDPGEIANSPDFDEHSLMTYLSLFPPAFSNLGIMADLPPPPPIDLPPPVFALPPPPAPVIPEPEPQPEPIFSEPKVEFEVIEESSNGKYQPDEPQPDEASYLPVASKRHANGQTHNDHVEDGSLDVEAAASLDLDEVIPEDSNAGKQGKSERRTSEYSRSVTRASAMLVPWREDSRMKVFSVKVVKTIQEY